MKAHQYSNLIKRIGFVCIAFALALALASFLSQDTINSSTQFSSPNPYYVQGENYSVLCCDPSYVSPRTDVYLNLSSENSSIQVYMMKTNSSEFNSWMGGLSNLSQYEYNGYYTSGSSASFLSYVSSHRGEVLNVYNVTEGALFESNFFPLDVEPLMVVILNLSNANTTVSTTLNQIGIILPPMLGFESAAGFLIVGAILSGFFYFVPRKI